MSYGIYENGEVIARFVVPMSVTSNRPVFSSDTLSLKRTIVSRGAQRWEIKTNLEPLSTSAEELFVHSVVNGFSTVFELTMPQNYGVIRRRAASAPLVTASGSKGSDQITISGATGLIPKGTFIRIGAHSKVYMTTADTLGYGVVGVFPNLLANVSGDLSYRDRVLGKFRYDSSNIQGMSYQDGILMDQGSVTFIEE